jgi:hypothetical protein
MRVVLDTNILVRANANARGPARELLLLLAGSLEYTLLLSPFLLQELERVFGYERVQAATKLTEEEILEYLRYLRSKDLSEAARARWRALRRKCLGKCCRLLHCNRIPWWESARSQAGVYRVGSSRLDPEPSR